jgi:hypothetical protein
MDTKGKGAGTMTEKQGRSFVYAAFFLAIGLLVQDLRLFFPMVPGLLSQFIIGTLVNALLMLSMLVTQRGWTAAVGFLLPLSAFLQGQLPVMPMLLVVGIGNAVYMLLVWRWFPRRMMWAAPFVKAALLYAGTRGVVALLALPAPLADMLGLMMGWPQLVTGTAGIVLGCYLLPRLQWRRR